MRYHADVIHSITQTWYHHVCVIVSHIRDTIKSVWYYVSRLRDTSFETSFRHRKKYLAEVLSFGPCNSECIHSKNTFQIIFGAKKFSSFFWNSEYFKCIKYHVSVILSRRRDTLYISMLTKYHTDVIVSRLCDSITQTWFSPNWYFCCG